MLLLNVESEEKNSIKKVNLGERFIAVACKKSERNECMDKCKRKKKIFIIVLLMGIILAFVVLYSRNVFPPLSERIRFKANWDVILPRGEEIYSYNEPFVTEYVLKCTDKAERKLRKILVQFKTQEGKDIKEKFFLEKLELSTENIEEKHLPDFNRIDYFMQKTKGMSSFYLFYDSNENILYVYEILD